MNAGGWSRRLRGAGWCALLALAACRPAGEEHGGAITMDEAETFSAIAPGETIHLIGTEPFWGGEVAAGTLRYTTPENIEGTLVQVARFAGNNGLGLSGRLDGRPLDLTVTPGTCSDGMSDRRYPFVATLRLGEDMRTGCAWTDARPFSGPEAP